MRGQTLVFIYFRCHATHTHNEEIYTATLMYNTATKVVVRSRYRNSLNRFLGICWREFFTAVKPIVSPVNELYRKTGKYKQIKLGTVPNFNLVLDERRRNRTNGHILTL